MNGAGSRAWSAVNTATAVAAPAAIASEICRLVPERPSWTEGNCSRWRPNAAGRKDRSGEVVAARAGSVGGPSPSCQRELRRGDDPPRRPERGDLLGVELAEAVERLDTGESVGADQRQAGVAKVSLREPVEDLEQLELIVEVVLEPEDDLLVVRDRGEGVVALLQVGQRRLVRCPPSVGKEAGPDRTQLLGGEPARDRPFVQHVASGDDRAGGADRRQAVAGGIAVSDVQHPILPPAAP